MCGIKDRTGGDGAWYVVLRCKTDSFAGKRSSCDERAVWWVPLRQLPGMKLASGMQSMLQLFCNDTMTELFFHVENGEWKETLK